MSCVRWTTKRKEARWEGWHRTRRASGCDHVPAGVAQAEAVGCALARKRNCDLVIRVAASIPIREKTRFIALVRRVGAGDEFCSLYKAGRAAPIDASQLSGTLLKFAHLRGVTTTFASLRTSEHPIATEGATGSCVV